MKIGIVGAGQVGATAAYSMMMRRVGSGILLVDRNADLAVAQARDILDATPLPIRCGSAQASWPILMARGWWCLPRAPTRGRGEPTGSAVAQRRNLRRDCAGGIGGHAGPDLSGSDQSGRRDDPDGHGNRGRRGVPSERVIGSGTVLNFARFRTLLAAHLGISPTYIDARVLGEHGDSEVLHWSGAAAGNLPVAEVARQMGRLLTEADRSRIDTGVRRAQMPSSKEKGQPGSGSAPVLPVSRRLLRTTSERCSPAPC